MIFRATCDDWLTIEIGQNPTEITVEFFAQSPVTQGIVGSANWITATICKVTGKQPAAVCSDPMIERLEQQLSGS